MTFRSPEEAKATEATHRRGGVTTRQRRTGRSEPGAPGLGGSEPENALRRPHERATSQICYAITGTEWRGAGSDRRRPADGTGAVSPTVKPRGTGDSRYQTGGESRRQTPNGRLGEPVELGLKTANQVYSLADRLKAEG